MKEMSIDFFYKRIKYFAKKQPECIALMDGEYNLTYRELFAAIGTYRKQLTKYAINKHSTIAVILPNNLAMALTLLTTLGHCSVLPLNDKLTEKELKEKTHDKHLNAIITNKAEEPRWRHIANQENIQILLVDGNTCKQSQTIPSSQSARHLNTTELQKTNSQHCLLLHTSGTTGHPKCVPIHISNLARSAKQLTKCLALTSTDTCLNLMPLTHIHGIACNLLATIYSGGCFKNIENYDKQKIFDDLYTTKTVTWLSAAPTLLLQLLNDIPADKSNSAHHLRFIRSCSASLHPATKTKLSEHFQTQVIQAYAMTEATHQISTEGLQNKQQKKGSVGKPYSVKVKILSKTRKALPSGCTGQIAIKGSKVFSGYLNDNESTKNSFYKKWFLTGDLGYFDDSGFLHISGRLKEMINRGGETISPVSIENTVLNVKGVKEACAFAVAHKLLGEDIALAIVIDNSTFQIETLTSKLQNELSTQINQSNIHIVESIPKNGTGKISRKTLTKKFTAKPNSIPPENTPEQSDIVRSIWANSLAIDKNKIQPKSNFFELGGYSISAIDMIANLSTHYPNVSMDLLIKHPEFKEFNIALIESSEHKEEKPFSKNSIHASTAKIANATFIFFWLIMFDALLVLLNLLKIKVIGSNFLLTLTNTVNLPGLAFISGIYASEEITQPRVRQLLLYLICPYFIVSALMYILGLSNQFLITADPNAWYLLTLAILNIISPFFRKSLVAITISLILMILVAFHQDALTGLGLSYTFALLPLFLLGKTYGLKCFMLTEKKWKYTGITLVSLLLPYSYLMTYTLNLPYEYFNFSNNLHQLKVTTMTGIFLKTIQYTGMLIGVLGIIFLAPSHEGRITRYGRNTLSAFVTKVFLSICILFYTTHTASFGLLTLSTNVQRLILVSLPFISLLLAAVLCSCSIRRIFTRATLSMNRILNIK